MAFRNIPGRGADNFKDSVPSAAQLPLNGNNIGDFRTVQDTGKPYYWNGTSWVLDDASNGITSLTGDVSATGPGAAAATVNSVGGSSAANVNTATIAANAATSNNTPNTIVKRNGSGNFNAGSIALSNFINQSEIATPTAPSAGSDNLYFKNTGHLYQQNSSAVEVPLVTGPVSSVNKGIARWNGTDGTTLSDSTIIIDTVTANSLFIGSLPNQSMSGTQDTVFGVSSGTAITSGTQNSIFGFLAGNLLTTGNGNTFLGFNTGNAITSQISNTLVGSGAGSAITSSNNTFVGFQSGHAATSNGDNTFFGYKSGIINTAAQNTFVGSQAGVVNTSGTSNTMVGYLAGGANTTSSNNTHVGWGAGFQGTGNSNTYIGSLAGQSAGAGSSNVCVGFSAGNLISSGSQNTYIGQQAGAGSTTTSQNTMLGFGAGANNTGSSNTYLGWEAGFSGPTTGSNNLYLGVLAASSATTGSNNIAIGNNSQLDANNASNRLVIGSSANPVSIGYFGQGGAPNAAPAGFTLAPTSASGTNIAGGAFVLTGGRSTGSGVGGAIQFQVSIATGSSATLNALTSVGSASGAGLWTIGASGGTQTHVVNGTLSATQNLITSVAGFGLQVKEGSNARMGTAVLVAGTVTVSNTSVTASTRIFLTTQTPGGVPGAVYISARTAATSFDITSTSVADTSTVAFLMVEPA